MAETAPPNTAPPPSTLLSDVRALQSGQLQEAAPPAAGPAPAQAPPVAAPPPAQVGAPGFPPTQATAPPPVDGAAPQPPSPELEQQRIRDAQARMHRATEEAAQARRDLADMQQENITLRDRMAGIMANPAFAPIIQRPEYQLPPGEDPVSQVFKEYQAAPNDEAAFRVLVDRVRGLTAEDQRRQFAAFQADRETRQRGQAQSQALWQEIDATVRAVAPDVPSDLFWMCSREAQARVPPMLNDPAVKLEWQVGEAIRLARAHRDEWLKPFYEQGQQAAALTRQAQVITPVRAATPTPSAPAPAQSLVDSIKAMQAERLGGAPR